MGRIQLRGNALVVYLLTLACYGAIMTNISLQRMQQAAERQDYIEQETRVQNAEEEELLSRWKLTQAGNKSKQTTWLHTAEDFYRRLSQPMIQCRKFKQLGGRSCH
ncbi:unnamed protein product, partial [Meganyctiphanes norvegica]